MNMTDLTVCQGLLCCLILYILAAVVKGCLLVARVVIGDIMQT